MLLHLQVGKFLGHSPKFNQNFSLFLLPGIELGHLDWPQELAPRIGPWSWLLGLATKFPMY